MHSQIWGIFSGPPFQIPLSRCDCGWYVLIIGAVPVGLFKALTIIRFPHFLNTQVFWLVRSAAFADPLREFFFYRVSLCIALHFFLSGNSRAFCVFCVVFLQGSLFYLLVLPPLHQVRWGFWVMPTFPDCSGFGLFCDPRTIPAPVLHL